MPSVIPMFTLLFDALALTSHHHGLAVKQPLSANNLLRARYLITAADDFVVDVYLNGKAVPESRRHMIEEKFGATAERIDVEVHKGDWLVFNIVNNRLRWGGAYYFAVAGCFDKDEFGFVSQRDTGDWSVCDTPRDVDRFISQKTYFRHRPAMDLTQPWAEGVNMMHNFAGNSWNGTPVWGATRNTWVKVIVE